MPTPIIIACAPTVAQLKLATAVRTSNPSTVARKVGSTGNTVRLLVAGAVKPTTRTIERYAVLGILPADWFTTAPEADLKPEPTVIEPGVESF